MGILASTMRLMTLTASKNDIEFRMMAITERMSSLTAQVADKDEFIGDLDPECAAVRQLEADKKKLNEAERKLKSQQDALQIRLKEIDQEIEACKAVIDNGIMRSGMFAYGMGGAR